MYGSEILNLGSQIPETEQERINKQILLSQQDDAAQNKHTVAKIRERRRMRDPQTTPDDDGKFKLSRQIQLLSSATQRQYRRSLSVVATDSGLGNNAIAKEFKKQTLFEAAAAKRNSILRMEYYEPLDYLICASHDGRVCRFSYLKLAHLTNADLMGYDKEILKYVSEGKGDGENDEDGRNDRVAGMMLRHVLENHKAPVTGFTCLFYEGTHYIITTGWDRRLCVWNLETGKLVEIFKNSDGFSVGQEELAADGIITDMAFSPERNEFAYSSADKLVYIRNFSTSSQDMKLKAALHGHKGEVSMVFIHLILEIYS